MAQQKVAVCTVDLFTSREDGTPLSLRIGDVWAADDAFVAEHPEYFGEIPEGKIRRSGPAVAAPQVERATRAPGERRTGRQRNG